MNKKSLVLGFILGVGVSTASIASADSTISAYLVNSMKFSFNGQQVAVPSDYVVLGYQGHTYVPAKFVAEQLGATVSWDGTTRTISINKGNDGSQFNPTGDSSSTPTTPPSSSTGTGNELFQKSYSVANGDITISNCSLKLDNENNLRFYYTADLNTSSDMYADFTVNFYDANGKLIGHTDSVTNWLSVDNKESTSNDLVWPDSDVDPTISNIASVKVIDNGTSN